MWSSFIGYQLQSLLIFSLHADENKDLQFRLSYPSSPPQRSRFSHRFVFHNVEIKQVISKNFSFSLHIIIYGTPLQNIVCVTDMTNWHIYYKFGPNTWYSAGFRVKDISDKIMNTSEWKNK